MVCNLATVITNLLSAIPVFGQDIVELIKIIECFNLGVAFFQHVNASINYNNIDIMFISTVIPVLPTLGTVHLNALKKGKFLRLDKKDYLSIPYQFIAFLVGLIDGDGYIQITRTPKGYITIKLVIGLQLDDISTLEYIKSVLKLGKLTINKDHRSPNCKLIINRTDLQEIFFPLLIHHGIFFITEARKFQFELAKFILKNDIKLYEVISSLDSDISLKKNTSAASSVLSRSITESHSAIQWSLPTPATASASEYNKLPFFKNWLVGFTVAEGSFLFKNNNDACYQLKQRIHVQLFDSFKLLFETNRKITTENYKYNQFSVSSKDDIQKVINFFSFSGLHPLIGLKAIQYLNWLNKLKISYRYNNLNFPLT